MPALTAQAAPTTYVPGEVIVKLKGAEISLSEHGIRSLTPVTKKNKKDASASANSKHGVDRVFVGKIAEGMTVPESIEKLRKDARVEYAEPNYYVQAHAVPNDPEFSRLWGLHNVGQTGGTFDADMDAPTAWNAVRATTNPIAVIDTGVDYTHPDLAANMWRNPGEIEGNGIDDEGNGYIDDVYGWDFYNGDNNPMDDHGHGTHVAGTIGAVGNNEVGVTGTAWSTSLAALKFIGSNGWGTTAGATEAIAYATQMGFRLSNNSWGGTGYSQALLDAITANGEAGALFVAAAGNSATTTDANPHYPSAYTAPSIISVAATDHADVLASFSNYGVESVDLAAPGVDIYSTVPTENCSLCDASGYRYLNGTSMATPHVTGAAALLWAIDPMLTPLDLKQRLFDAADPVPALAATTLTGRRLNIGNFFPTDQDTTAPAAISNLAITSVESNRITLSWTAPGDDGLTGTAAQYDVRYSTSPIPDAAAFFRSQTAVGEPLPGLAGTPHSFALASIFDGITYYVAVRAMDDAGNYGPLSNVVSTTTPDTLNRYTIFSDNVENGRGAWQTNSITSITWHPETKRSASPTMSWAFNSGAPDYTYDGQGKMVFSGVANAPSAGTLTSPLINLANQTSPYLRFAYWYQTQDMGTAYDKREIFVGVNGTFTKVAQLSNDPMLQWNTATVDLREYAGQQIQIQFSFDTIDNVDNVYEGWYIDDIVVRGTEDPGIDAQAPTIPTDLTALAPTYNRVDLAWATSTDNVAVAGYHVFRNSVQIGTSTSPSFADTTVTEGQQYTYWVKAFDAAGNVSGGSATTTVTVPRQAVAILTHAATNVAPTSATIKWTTNLPSTGVVTYKTGTLSKSVTTTMATTTHSVLLSSLTKNSAYTYQITANANNTSATSTGSFTTPRR